jgi:hypothetical protein
MNSKEAARLCFGNPGFFDFLKPVLNLVKSNVAAVRTAASVNPTFKAFTDPLFSVAKVTAPIASSIPYIGDIVQPFATAVAIGDRDPITEGSDSEDDAGPIDEEEEL